MDKVLKGITKNEKLALAAFVILRLWCKCEIDQTKVKTDHSVVCQ